MDDKLDELLELTRENNKLLRKIHRANLWDRIFRTLYYIIIIGGFVGTYYFIQPYLEGKLATIQTLISNIEGMKESATSGNMTGIQELFKKLQ